MAPSVSPLNWTGNKSCIYDMISGFMPEHTVYIEPCMGSAEVFLRKKPAKKEIINDYNGDLVNFFRVLQSTPHLPELIGRLYLSFHSEEMFKRNQKLLAETPNLLDDVFDMLNIVCEITSKDVERAAAFFENQVYSFSSMGTSFAIAQKDITSKFPKLRAASNRLRDAIIMHRDYKDVIRDQACVGAFILLDPPYKGTEAMYKKSNFDANEHDNLFELMNGVHLEHLGGKQIDASSYDRVFTGEIPGKTLEDVFQVFNTGGHRLHRGHSLSVSDVVELRDPAGDTPAGFYFCDSVGFQPVAFDPDQAQVPDRLCRILVLEPHRKPYESELVDELSNLQRAVGGLIEFTYPFDDNTIVCGNEEAKLEGQEGNRRIYGSVYAGNLFLVGDDGDGGLTSLTDEQMEKYSEMFAQPDDISQEEVEADTGFIFYGF